MKKINKDLFKFRHYKLLSHLNIHNNIFKTVEKDLVVGLGEIGLPIYTIISKNFPTHSYDIDKKLIPNNPKKLENYPVRFLHICIPYNKKFFSNVLKLNKKFSPKSIIIHSTVKPKTTQNLQKKLSIPIIYSATRGIHKRMIIDLKRYTKFFALNSKMRNSVLMS